MAETQKASDSTITINAISTDKKLIPVLSHPERPTYSSNTYKMLSQIADFLSKSSGALMMKLMLKKPSQQDTPKLLD